MKKTISAVFILVFSLAVAAQPDTLKAPYLRFPTYPPVKIFLTDSTTFFTKEELKKKSPVLLMFFDPGCDHCKKETEEILQNMEKLEDVQIIMTSYKPLTEIKGFIEHFGLGKYKNIVVGQDLNFFLPSFFQISFFPFMAFYNKKKELIDVFQGPISMEKLIEIIHK